ncbi:hypothetical protein [Ectopseudomonas composti]|uniref:hypothetical protein n=1 Tax=Ectopseudomonas composti TaxID=658457 RepID=UPI0010394287|nr:hypothetical protein [Pseudomonas composti]
MSEIVAIELLKEIASNTASKDSLWIALVAGGSGVLGAAVSALIAYFAANRATHIQKNIAEQSSSLELKKLRASIITTERLRWLQDLRSQVAEFYSYIDIQTLHIERLLDPRVTPISRDELDRISKEAGLKANLILLMINRESTEQDQLFRSINSALIFINKLLANIANPTNSLNRQEIAEIKEASYKAMHEIGEKVWNKVQALD